MGGYPGGEEIYTSGEEGTDEAAKELSSFAEEHLLRIFRAVLGAVTLNISKADAKFAVKPVASCLMADTGIRSFGTWLLIR